MSNTDRSDLKGCLTRILRPEHLAGEPTQEDEITLRECQAKMSVKITDVSSSYTTIRLTGYLSALESGPGCGWNQICDYMLIDDLGDKCHVVLVELKKTLNDDRNKAFEQLRRSLPMADYLLSVCGVELRTSWQCTVSYVLIAEKQANRFDKQRVRLQPGLRKREPYDGIEVSVFVGATVKAADLAAC